jgi:hypothetical protein
VVSGCEHEWRWLPEARYEIGANGLTGNAYNIECARCGTLAWGHGTPPNAKPITVKTPPTTGRS